MHRKARAVFGSLLAVASFAAMAGQAWAGEAWVCVPEKAGEAVKSGGTGASASCGVATVALQGGILTHMKYVASGIDEKPTVEITGINVQILSGLGEEGKVNGEGNLLLGYQTSIKPLPQTGSASLAVGYQGYTGYGDLAQGSRNRPEAEGAAAIGGASNTVLGVDGVAIGGVGNVPEAKEAATLGGAGNHASGVKSVVVGGLGNKSEAEGSTIAGGTNNKTNKEAPWSGIFGGHLLTTTKEFEALL